MAEQVFTFVSFSGAGGNCEKAGISGIPHTSNPDTVSTQRKCWHRCVFDLDNLPVWSVELPVPPFCLCFLLFCFQKPYIIKLKKITVLTLWVPRHLYFTKKDFCRPIHCGCTGTHTLHRRISVDLPFCTLWVPRHRVWNKEFCFCLSGDMGAHTATMNGTSGFDISLFRCMGVQYTHNVRMRMVQGGCLFIFCIFFKQSKPFFARIYSDTSLSSTTINNNSNR